MPFNLGIIKVGAANWELLINLECLGIRKGFFFILLFSPLKSEINLTVPFILGTVKVGDAHWELLIFFNTSI